MARKPAVMYRQVKGQAYTRRKYMGGVPNSRISQFDMGNLRGIPRSSQPQSREPRSDKTHST